MNLINGTGLQFLNIKLNLTEDYINTCQKKFHEKIESIDAGSQEERKLIEPFHWRQEDVYFDPAAINQGAYNRYGKIDTNRINSNMLYGIKIDHDNIYSVTGEEALNVFEGHWVPLPYFKIKTDPLNPFHEGPMHWCRGILEKSNHKDSSHVLTLLFDTRTSNFEDQGDYLFPNEQDATANANERFRCVIERKHAESFFNQDYLKSWLTKLYSLGDVRTGQNMELRYMSMYHCFIHLIAGSKEDNRGNPVGFPTIGLLSGNDDPIKVALSLDIGNSRTCGLICEKDSPGGNKPFEFTSARKLRIRDLTKPQKVYDDPFEMQIAFSEEKFGNPAAESIVNAFKWPSLVRVGPEAITLTSMFESANMQATLSSPKKYLWDKQRVNVPWTKVDRDGRLGYHERVVHHKHALYGIAAHMTDDGRAITPTKQKDLLPATESNYSRSSLMTMAIYELLLQAVSQINDFEFRQDMGNDSYRRQLSDIVITCPTAMTLQEQHQLLKSAEDAVILIKKSVGRDIPLHHIEVHPKKPDLDPSIREPNAWKMDEASCSQLAYMYGELAEKYNGKYDLFFQVKGKKRLDDERVERQSINVASIDIGGGTTDLMICNYHNQAGNAENTPLLKPEPLFWEGFNIAGDDLVKKLIELLVIPVIEQELLIKNGENISQTLNNLFGPDIGGQSAKDKIYRRQFANQVAAPVAYLALDHAIRSRSSRKTIKLGDAFIEHPRPENGLVEYLNKKLKEGARVDDFNLEGLEIVLDAQLINEGIRNILSPVIEQLGFLIAHFQCDIILLSGRPSRLPIITDMLVQTMLFSPDKIICLGNYRFGNWYPFADSNGYVHDPKSTVCVGALIAFLGKQGVLPSVHLNFENFKKIESTAKYIGTMDNSLERIKKRDEILTPEQNSGSFSFRVPVVLGMRQMASEEWIASPLYVFDFKDTERRDRFYREGFLLPLSVKVSRHGDAGEFIRSDDLVIKDDRGKLVENSFFEVTLRTSGKMQEHWRDTGSFVIRLN